MTIPEINTRIEAIKAVLDDDERAHALEDDLHLDFIKFIAVTAPSELPLDLTARAALVASTEDLEFARWCA